MRCFRRSNFPKMNVMKSRGAARGSERVCGLQAAELQRPGNVGTGTEAMQPLAHDAGDACPLFGHGDAMRRNLQQMHMISSPRSTTLGNLKGSVCKMCAIS